MLQRKKDFFDCHDRYSAWSPGWCVLLVYSSSGLYGCLFNAVDRVGSTSNRELFTVSLPKVYSLPMGPFPWPYTHSKQVADMIEASLVSGKHVLVHCAVGRNRSTSARLSLPECILPCTCVACSRCGSDMGLSHHSVRRNILTSDLTLSQVRVHISAS